MKEDNNPVHDDAKGQNGAGPSKKTGRQDMAPAVDDGADRIKVGITHGDFNGIGYEVILKALDD